MLVCIAVVVASGAGFGWFIVSLIIFGVIAWLIAYGLEFIFSKVRRNLEESKYSLKSEMSKLELEYNEKINLIKRKLERVGVNNEK